MNAFLVSLASAGLLLSASAAQAQLSSPMGRIPCHNYKEISTQLDKRYQEAPISIGMQSNGNMLQVFASKEMESWTILSVTPQGLGCILAAGRNWEELQAKFPQEGPET